MGVPIFARIFCSHARHTDPRLARRVITGAVLGTVSRCNLNGKLHRSWAAQATHPHPPCTPIVSLDPQCEGATVTQRVAAALRRHLAPRPVAQLALAAGDRQQTSR